MSDAPSPVSVTSTQESLRGIAILSYALLLAAFFNGFTAIAAVVLAYIKRRDARGTIYESHFSNIIETFWISLALAVLGGVTVFIGIGFLILLFLAVFYFYRGIKGIIRAVDDRPYA